MTQTLVKKQETLAKIIFCAGQPSPGVFLPGQRPQQLWRRSGPIFCNVFGSHQAREYYATICSVTENVRCHKKCSAGYKNY